VGRIRDVQSRFRRAVIIANLSLFHFTVIPYSLGCGPVLTDQTSWLDSSHVAPVCMLLGCTVQTEYKRHFVGTCMPDTESGWAIQ